MLKGQVENELDKLEKQGVIKKSDRSHCVSPTVVVPKADNTGQHQFSEGSSSPTKCEQTKVFPGLGPVLTFIFPGLATTLAPLHTGLCRKMFNGNGQMTVRKLRRQNKFVLF